MGSVFVIAGISLLGAMMPGPDFFLVTRLSLQKSRAAGVAAALGIGCGLCIHLLYMSIGLAVVIVRTPWLMDVIRVCGALYLCYLGLQAWRDVGDNRQAQCHIKQGFGQGLLTNLLNPKVILFLLALMSSIEVQRHHVMIIIMSAISIVVVDTLWFIVLSYCITLPWFTRVLQKIQPYLGKLVGSFLLLFAAFNLMVVVGWL